MGFESKLAPLTVWLHTIQRQMSDGHWYNKIPEVLGDYRQVVQCDASSFTSISCHIPGQVCMRTVVLLGVEGQRYEPWALKQEHH